MSKEMGQVRAKSASNEPISSNSFLFLHSQKAEIALAVKVDTNGPQQCRTIIPTLLLHSLFDQCLRQTIWRMTFEILMA